MLRPKEPVPTSRQMRILLTADPYIPVPPIHYGGIERIVAALATDLRRNGHIVGLVAHPDSQAKTDFFAAWPDVNPRGWGGNLRNAAALRRAMRCFQPTVVHSFSRLFYLAPLLRKKVAKVMSYQRRPSGRQIRIAERLGKGSLVFTGCSEHIAHLGRQSGGVWRAIPNFVDTDVFSFAPVVPDDAPLVFLSRVEELKGAHIAIQIAKSSGRKLKIAGNYGGTPVDIAYWEQCIVPELGKNGIEYVGTVDDEAKIALLRSAAAMVVPIQWDEPFGIVFAESLACGTPIISCPRGALPEIVRHGIDGYLINNVEEGCAAVQSLASIDRRQCRERAEAVLSVRVVGQRYLDLYGEIANALAPPP